MAIELILDEKKYYFPESWSDVTIEQFQKLCEVEEWENWEDDIEKNINIISVLGNISIDKLMDVPASKYADVCNLLSFIKNEIPEEIYKEITINDVIYSPDFDIENYTTAQFIDTERLIKDYKDLHLAMAIIWRPVVDGKIEKYDTKTVKERAELFRKKMNVKYCISSQVFFCVFEQLCLTDLKEFLKKK